MGWVNESAVAQIAFFLNMANFDYEENLCAHYLSLHQR